MARKGECKATGLYVVVTYGPHGTWGQPWYLKKNPKRKLRKNEDILACHYFTGYLSDEVEFFVTRESAEEGAEHVRKLYAKHGHILANTFKAAMLCTKLV